MLPVVIVIFVKMDLRLPVVAVPGGFVPGGHGIPGLVRRLPGGDGGADHIPGLLEGLAHLVPGPLGHVLHGNAQVVLRDVLGVPQGAFGLVQGPLDDLLHVFQQVLQLPAVPLVGAEHQLGQGLVGVQAVEVLHQLVGVPQAVQGLAVGLLRRGAGGGEILIALVEVVGQLLDELRLGHGMGGGGQLAGHRVGQTHFDVIHNYVSSSMEIKASSRARVSSHSRMFSAHCRLPASVME